MYVQFGGKSPSGLEWYGLANFILTVSCLACVSGGYCRSPTNTAMQYQGRGRPVFGQYCMCKSTGKRRCLNMRISFRTVLLQRNLFQPLP